MAITLDNHVKAETNNSASLTSSAITTAAAPLLVMVNVGQGTVGNSDSKANTWVLGASQNFNGTNGITHFWYVQNATGGTLHTFTGTQSGGAGPQFLVASFLGCALSGGLNASAFTELANTTASVTGPTVTTTVAGCLIVTVMVGGAPTLITPTSANGAVTDAFSTNGNNVSGALSWFVAGAPGNYSDTLTFAGQTNFDYAMYTMAFAPAAGAVIAGPGYVSTPGPGISPSARLQFRASRRSTDIILPPPVVVPNVGYLAQSGPSLASPFNVNQFRGFPFSTFIAPPPIIPPLQLGYVRKPGPGVSPSKRDQFFSFLARSTTPAGTAPINPVTCSGGTFDALTPMPGLML